MKLVFPTTFDYPTRFAHPIYGLRMARAFAKLLGGNFLFARGQVADAKILAGIPSVSVLGRWPRRVKKLRLRKLFVMAWLVRFLLNHRGRDVAFYVIDRPMAAMLLFLKRFFSFKIIFEYHDFYKTALDKKILSRVDAVVFLTRCLADEAAAFFPSAGKSVIIGGGIDTKSYEEVVGKPIGELREMFGLPRDTFIVGYFGRFRPLNFEKGVAELVAAARVLPDDVLLLCVGGTKEELEYYGELAQKENTSDRIRLIPFAEPDRIPAYQAACDALAYVPPANQFFQRTFPMKLLEYMAAQKPVIVSDTPSFREIFDNDTAYFVPPGDADAVARRISEIRAHPDEAQQKAARAFKRVALYEWNKRAQKILELI